eukprot:13822452-Alexandrium_andersonii.AAC.1
MCARIAASLRLRLPSVNSEAFLEMWPTRPISLKCTSSHMRRPALKSDMTDALPPPAWRRFPP